MSFMVHLCKMMISLGFFYFFKILIVWVVKKRERWDGGWKGKSEKMV